jgi:hypothetical protein
MSVQPLNPSRGGSLAWAWKMLDRHRRRENVNAHQIDFALAAIANATGRAPIRGSPTHEFDDEERLRLKAAPR